MNAAPLKAHLVSPQGVSISDNESGSSKEISSISVTNAVANSTMLGGAIDTEALCLLDGFVAKDGSPSMERFTLPITGLPATIGRSHQNSEDKYFFGMGFVKALSRQQCRIEYWINTRGDCLELDKSSGKFQIHKVESRENVKFVDPSNSNIPTHGFYVITCLGKNRIFVNGKKVEQGQSCYLSPNATVRISSFMLYFILPSEPLTETMTVSAPMPRRRSFNTLSPAINANAAEPTAKRSRATQDAGSVASSSNNTNNVPASSSNNRASNWPSLQAELDTLDTSTMLNEIDSAISNGVWERRHQLLGSTLAYRAILEASKDPAILKLISTTGASRGQLMDWIAASPKFSKWVEQMLTRLEPKSYQASITKALIKANFERTGTTGRYIKWILPEVVGGTKVQSAKSGNKESHVEGQNYNNESEDDEGIDSENDDANEDVHSEDGDEAEDQADDNSVSQRDEGDDVANSDENEDNSDDMDSD